MARTVSIALATLLLLLGLVSHSLAGCTGSPPTYNGLPCATTTRYWDGQMGACGCGTGNTNPFEWQYQQYTAAASQLVFDPSLSSWCGSGCGSCFELTPSGDCPYGGVCYGAGTPITVMVTNLCPYNGNEAWCPNPGQVNSLGYAQHFDLMDFNMDGLISELGWNNPVVTYKQVPCGSNGSPTCSDAAQCECATPGCQQGSASSSSETSVPASSSSSSSSSFSFSSEEAAPAPTPAPTPSSSSEEVVIPSPSASASSSSEPAAASSSSEPAAASSSSEPAAASSSSEPAAASSSSEPSAPSSSSAEPAAPSSSESPSAASSTEPVGSADACGVSVSFDTVSVWPGGGMVVITIQNAGSVPITALELTVPGENLSTWNLQATSGSAFTLPSWAFPIYPSSTIGAVGYTFTGDLAPAAGELVSSSC